MYLLWIMSIFLALYIVRITGGLSVWDRLLGLNLISTKIIVIIIVFASLHETAYLLDFAIVCALLGFMGIVFITRFLLGRIKGDN